MVTGAIACSFVIVAAVPAHAASPANDDESGAVRIGALPFTATQDTTEATTSGPDICSKSGSVFYRYTPSSDTRVQIDTIGSDYDTELGVYRRTRAGIDRVACDDDRFYPQSGVRFLARAGERYYVMASRERRAGGSLTLTVTEVAGGAFTASTTVTGATYDAETGNATVTGTIECSKRSVYYVEMELRQLRHHGLFVAHGYSYDEDTCTPEDGGTWTVEVESESGVAFGAGDAHVESFLYASDGFGNRVREDQGASTVQLVAA